MDDGPKGRVGLREEYNVHLAGDGAYGGPHNCKLNGVLALRSRLGDYKAQNGEITGVEKYTAV